MHDVVPVAVAPAGGLPRPPAAPGRSWARVRGYLHITGPTIENKRWERLFVTELLAGSAGVALADLDHRIADHRAAGNRWDGADLAVDVTGATVPISLALLRVAALAGAACVYVAKEQRGQDIVPGTQHARQFDPRALTGAIPT